MTTFAVPVAVGAVALLTSLVVPPAAATTDVVGSDVVAAASESRASGFRVTVTPTRVAARAGSVEVRLRGLPDHAGVYVRFCRMPAGGDRPTAADCLSTRGAWGGVWAVARYPYGARPTDGSVVSPDRPFRLAYRASFNGIDCTKARCGVAIRRDHRASSDTSYDRFIRVRFAS